MNDQREWVASRAGTTSCLLVMFAILLAATATDRAAAHELPDGVVERAIQVTAWPDRIEVQYQFGLSENTMRSRLEADGLTPASSLEQLETQFLAWIAPSLPTGVTLSSDDQPLVIGDASNQLIYQHHLQFECRWVYPWTATGTPQQLALTDENFPDIPGHFRVAVRGRGDVEVQSDATAPILVRAPRTPVQGNQRGGLEGPSLAGRARLANANEPHAAAASVAGSDAVDPQDARSAQPSNTDSGNNAQSSSAHAEASSDASGAGSPEVASREPPSTTPSNGTRFPQPEPRAPAWLWLVVILIGALSIPLLLARPR